MTSQATFTLQAHNPDVLTCIANLSNDEVFTPPELANQMLDTLESAWAESNGGASIWADSTVTFLDPFTKSGVFLREIVSRLIDGLAVEIEDLQTRVDHILTRQVFGIGITQLTALLARRSVYCSKYANGEHSVATSFDTEEGNIWFERTEHTWEKRKTVPRANPTGPGNYRFEVPGTGRCKFCGAQESAFDRDSGLETHAYDFIHTGNIKARMAELFGADMQFDVIIGNPPYQMSGASGGSSDASIYHLFAEQAQALEPRYLSMVVPSRWLAGGRGLESFRTNMLKGGQVRALVDYFNAKDMFPGIELKGGSCYFLWDRSWRGKCEVVTLRDGVMSESVRDLGEFDVFIRDSRAVSVLHKVLAPQEELILPLVSRDTPFGIATNFRAYDSVAKSGTIAIFAIEQGKRVLRYLTRSSVKKNAGHIDTWKVLVPEAYGAGESYPHQILGVPQIAGPPSVCTQSYLTVGPFEDESAAASFRSYYSTRFFRFLVSLRKITQHAIRSTYSWVPMQEWDRAWTDEELYAKYGLDDDEIAFIESMIRPMELDNE